MKLKYDLGFFPALREVTASITGSELSKELQAIRRRDESKLAMMKFDGVKVWREDENADRIRTS